MDVSCHRLFLPGTSLEPAVIPTAQASSFTLQYVPYYYYYYYYYYWSRDSVVGIATRYGLDGPGVESRWGRDFPHLSRPALRPTQPPIQWVPSLSWG